MIRFLAQFFVLQMVGWFVYRHVLAERPVGESLVEGAAIATIVTGVSLILWRRG